MRFRAEARQAKPKHCILIGARKMAAFLLSVCACMCVVTTTKFILVLTICPAQTTQQQRGKVFRIYKQHTQIHTHTRTHRDIPIEREWVSHTYFHFSPAAQSKQQAARQHGSSSHTKDIINYIPIFFWLAFLAFSLVYFSVPLAKKFNGLCISASAGVCLCVRVWMCVFSYCCCCFATLVSIFVVWHRLLL